MEEVRRSMSGRKSNQLGAGACKNAELGNPAQKLLRLGYRLAGANLDFGEAPEEEPQGPKLVNKRFSSGCARFVGAFCQKKKKTLGQPRDPLCLFGRNKGKKIYGRKRILTGDCTRRW